MRRPAGMRDADMAGGRIMAEHFGQIAQLAFGAPPHQLAIVHGADPSRVITAIFHPPQAIDQIIDNVAPGENSNDTTHAAKRLSKLVGNADARHFGREILCITCDEDAPANLGGGENDGIHGFQSLPLTSHRGSPRGDFLIDLVNAET